MTDPQDTTSPDENHIIAERRAKLARLREVGIAYPNDFRTDAFAGDIEREYADAESFGQAQLEALGRRVQVAGRLMAKRVMGVTAVPAAEHARPSL